MNWELLIQLMLNGVIVGTLYGVVAACFVLIYKATQVINFAQGDFLYLGAAVCWSMVVTFQLPFWLAFPLAFVFMAAFGYSVQRVLLRPMIGEPLISVIMITIGLSVVMQKLLTWIYTATPHSYPQIFASNSIEIGPLTIETAYVMSMIISLVIMLGFYVFFRYSRYGLAMRATAFNQQTAQSLGISVNNVFAMAWVISAVVSALAGVVVGLVNGVSPALAFIGIKVFPAVILGGLDSIVGGIAGGVIIGVLENLAEFVDSQYLHIGNMYAIAPFWILVIILMIKPYGLFGTKDIERL